MPYWDHTLIERHPFPGGVPRVAPGLSIHWGEDSPNPSRRPMASEEPCGAGGLPEWRRWTAWMVQVDRLGGAGAIFSWWPAPLVNYKFLIFNLLIIHHGAGDQHFSAPAPRRATGRVVSSMEKADLHGWNCVFAGSSMKKPCFHGWDCDRGENVRLMFVKDSKWNRKMAWFVWFFYICRWSSQVMVELDYELRV